MAGISSLITMENILKSVKGVTVRYLEQRESAGERRLEQLRVTLDAVKEITWLHLSAIVEVTKPLVFRKDFAATYQLFHLLVNNADLQTVYPEIQGHLKVACQWPESAQSDELFIGLKKIRSEVRNFQYGAFTISCDEAFRDEVHPGKAAILSDYPISQHFMRSKLLYDVWSDPETDWDTESVKHLKQEVLSGFIRAFYYVQPVQEEKADTLKSCKMSCLDDLISLNSSWFSLWQQSAEKRLFAKDGMYAAIGDLEEIMKTF
jgi:hypothetical protein